MGSTSSALMVNGGYVFQFWHNTSRIMKNNDLSLASTVGDARNLPFLVIIAERRMKQDVTMNTYLFDGRCKVSLSPIQIRRLLSKVQGFEIFAEKIDQR
jgi:hypothetical protein